MSVSINNAGHNKMNELISEGKTKDGAWNFSTEDGDALLGPNGDDWENYALWFLGHKPGADPHTREAYAYPFGKKGKVWLSALRAIASRAAQHDAHEISQVASSALADLQKSVKLTMTVRQEQGKIMCSETIRV